MDNENMNDFQEPQKSRAKEIIYKITGWDYLKETDKCARPVNWLKFYIYLQMPFGIIYGTYTRISKWGYYGIGLSIISILMILFQIVVYIYLRKLTKKGYYLNIAYLIIGGVFSCVMYIQAMFVYSSTYYSSVIGIVLFLMIWDVIYVLLNVVYFKKRRDLFINDAK
ncbi:MAG: hypothetical protein AAGU14_08450 [Eubacteriaceae bacterium]